MSLDAGRSSPSSTRASPRDPSPTTRSTSSRSVRASNASPMAARAGQSSTYASSDAARTSAARARGPSGKRRATWRNASRASARACIPSKDKPRLNRYSAACAGVGLASTSVQVSLCGFLPALPPSGRAPPVAPALLLGSDFVRRHADGEAAPRSAAEVPASLMRGWAEAQAVIERGSQRQQVCVPSKDESTAPAPMFRQCSRFCSIVGLAR